MTNEWIKKIEELERKVHQLKANLNFEMLAKDRDRWKKLYYELVETTQVLQDLTERKN